MKNIVVVGGGSGTFNVLKGLKKEKVNITSIVTAFDEGGSTGVLRDEFGILPPGDLRRSLVALMPDNGSQLLRDLFNYRYDEASSLSGHSFGNLFIQALIDITGSEMEGIEKAAELLGINGHVAPVSFDKARLHARLESGDVVVGETNIDIPKHNGDLKIEEVYLEPQATLSYKARHALEQADFVILGPGDLYTSIIPNFLVNDFVDSLQASSAKLLYICNLMTKWGETTEYKVSDFVKEILRYLKIETIDYVLCNSSEFSQENLDLYKKTKSEPVVCDMENLEGLASHIIHESLVSSAAVLRHNSNKLNKEIMKVVHKE